MREYYGDPEPDCDKCLEAGLDDCACDTYNEHDPLDNPVVLGLPHPDDGLTKEQTREIEEMVRADNDTVEAYMEELARIADMYGLEYE